MSELSVKQLKPSVCVDAVFEGVPMADSVKAVSGLGYPAFEFWCWWEKDLVQLKELCEQYELEISACCTKFISLTQPELRGQYLDGLGESIEAAKKLNCRTLISQVGDFVPNIDRQRQHECLVLGLMEASQMLENSGVTLVIEPLNEKVDHPGYYLIHSDEAFEIVKKVNSPDVKVVFDIYHQQISEGNLLPNILNHLDWIGHFHAAGQPGRHELSRGEINYPEIFSSIGSAGFEGFVGLEYWPVDDPTVGLKKVADWFGS